MSTIDGETRSRPGPHRRTFLTSRLRPRLLAGALLSRGHECRLELAHVLALQEQPEGCVDVRRPRKRCHDAMCQRSCEPVTLQLRTRPLEVGAVQLRVRILAGRYRALDRIERVLRPLAPEEAEPLDRGRTMRRALRQREAV